MAAVLSLGMATTGVAGVSGQESQTQIGRMGDPVGVAREDHRFSEAETLLWLSDHMENVRQPVRLNYRFRKSGSYEEGFEDFVRLDVLQLHKDGSKTLDIDFFSSERRQNPMYASNLRRVRGNPVLGLFLQGDMYEMERLTEGSWRHFQRRMKFAFAAATVEKIRLQYEGDEVEAQRIFIRPYSEDSKRDRYEMLADKSYEFVFSDRVPGKLYQVNSVIAASEPGAEPLIAETLVFSGVEEIP
ncbi:MAG: hypothetical protein OXU54_08710 [Gammaproteobacteria bacterium]|nr:hypothetical protein [Gammaproteobacteria bacterium]